MLPWVKRHVLQAATLHLTYSVPETQRLKWKHSTSFNATLTGAEMSYVVCARQDWIEQRFRVYLWREADNINKLMELTYGVCGGK